MQSHAVSGMSTRKELANPFPRCKKQRQTKSRVSSGVSLRKGRGVVVVKSSSGRNDRNKKEFRKITGCIYIELEGSLGQSRVGSLTFQPVACFIHACETVHA